MFSSFLKVYLLIRFFIDSLKQFSTIRYAGHASQTAYVLVVTGHYVGKEENIAFCVTQ